MNKQEIASFKKAHALCRVAGQPRSLPTQEIARFKKAHALAQLLLDDIRDVHSKTNSIAVEELMVSAIEQVVNLSRLLNRLSSQRD